MVFHTRLRIICTDVEGTDCATISSKYYLDIQTCIPDKPSDIWDYSLFLHDKKNLNANNSFNYKIPQEN